MTTPHFEHSAANDALMHHLSTFSLDFPEEWEKNASKLNDPVTTGDVTVLNPVRYCSHCDEELMTVGGKYEHHDGRYAPPSERENYYDWKNDPEGYADHEPTPTPLQPALNRQQFKELG